MPIGFQIAPRPAPVDGALIEALRGIPTSVVSDTMGRLAGIGPLIRPVHDGTPMIGVALTVRTRPGDNLMVHKAVDMAEPGEVILVEAGGDMASAIIGEIVATLAASRGVAGFVIDGSVRDSDALRRSSFPVFARGITHRGPFKDGPGEIAVPARIGDQIVWPGDIVLGDADGVLAVPRGIASEVARGARARLDQETRTLAEIRAGTLDRSWVDAALRAKGVL